jgi:cell division transport system permease protein
MVALFVVGNSIRASIASRRDEIEILELVGATPDMVRAPYVFEGAAMGFAASAIALAANFAAWLWEARLLRESFAVSRLAEGFTFLSPAWLVVALAAGTALGALGAYLIVRSINDGWAASQGLGQGAEG